MAAACFDFMNWYVIHAKPRQESVALLNLQREKIETFFPQLRRKRTIRRVRKWVTGPLFPGYFFARFDASLDGRLVRYANGVINVVSFGGKPTVVEPGIITAIKEYALGDVVTVQATSLRQGDHVEIQTGPFRGLQGIFEREMSDSARVVVLLQVLAKGARVEVSRDQVEPVP